MATMLTIEIEREDDGRWIAEIVELPGVVAYGASEAEARPMVYRPSPACDGRTNREWRAVASCCPRALRRDHVRLIT